MSRNGRDFFAIDSGFYHGSNQTLTRSIHWPVLVGGPLYRIVSSYSLLCRSLSKRSGRCRFVGAKHDIVCTSGFLKRCRGRHKYFDMPHFSQQKSAPAQLVRHGKWDRTNERNGVNSNEEIDPIRSAKKELHDSSLLDSPPPSLAIITRIIIIIHGVYGRKRSVEKL